MAIIFRELPWKNAGIKKTAAKQNFAVVFLLAAEGILPKGNTNNRSVVNKLQVVNRVWCCRMEKKQCINVSKISAVLQHASVQATGDNLKRLRYLTSEGAELAEEMLQVTAKLRQVAAPPEQPFLFTTKLPENEHLLKVTFRDCADIIFRYFDAGDKKAMVIFLYGMADVTLLEKNVLETLMKPAGEKNVQADFYSLLNKLITSASLRTTDNASDAVNAVLEGNTLLLLDGISDVFIIGTVKHVKRQVSEALIEDNIRGPQDGFNETLRDNIVLVRRRARDSNMKMRLLQIGERTKTTVALMYSADLVKPGLLEEVEARLGRIKIDKVLTATMLEELIVEHPWCPFPQVQTTERPEKAVAAIYEGRVAILVDNTPSTMLVPVTYGLLIQSTDDYTLAAPMASLIRFTRHICAFVAVYLPAVYVGLISYNLGVLPTPLALSIAELRTTAPFPAVVEAMIMEALLEIFQEAVVRLPKKIAPSVGVVGAMVIGTTIVQANIVGPLMVVVTAVTAIASYSMPSYNLSMALRFMRVPMLILAGVLGLYGVVLGALLLTVYFCSLTSFGESYFGSAFDITMLEDWKDILVRWPMPFLGARSKAFGAQERKRMEE